MAVLSQTPASVGVSALAGTTRIVQVGEAVTQGMPGYRSEAGKYYKADATDPAKDAAEVIFLTAALTDGFAVVAMPGVSVNLGATLTVGTSYYVDNTAGSICEYSDLVSTDYITLLGIADSASSLLFNPQVSGVQKP